MQFGKIEKYLLFGGGTYLADFAHGLKLAGYDVLVITDPRHSQEKVSDEFNTFGSYLESLGLRYITSKDVNIDQNVVDVITPKTLGLSLGAAWIFCKEFINRFNGKLLNLHKSRLPQGRGGGNLSWPILSGSRLDCFVIHQIDTRIDTGPIVTYHEFFYPTWCRIPKDYQQVLLKEIKDFLGKFFRNIQNEEEFQCIGQPEYLSTYWPRLSAEHHGYIDWNWNLKQIEKFICAFDEPYKGASTFINDRRVFIKNCFIDMSDGVFHPFQNGIVYRKSLEMIFVATEDGTLVIGSVKDERGVNMTPKIKVGDRFYTPKNCLEQARRFRVRYTSAGLKLKR